MNNESVKAREHIPEILCAVLGIAAILASLFVKGLAIENILDAIKDIVGFLVTIVVFVFARSVYREMTHKDFLGRFEKLLAEWAQNNNYLVDEKSAQEERGKEGKRCYDMLVDPSNLVTAESRASETTKKKGAFVYLPSRNQMECLVSGKGQQAQEELTIEFRLNKSTFQSGRGSNEIADDDISLIASQFAQRINKEFTSSLSINAQVKDKDNKVIVVPLTNIPKTEEAARLLVAMVDFVKNMVLVLSKPSDDYIKNLRKS